MLYVHVAEAHPRQPPKHVQKAARRISDPDARVLVMLGARGAESSSETTPNRCAVAKAWEELRP